MPNNYADYKNSEEQTREIRDWKARLYHHQLKKAKNSKSNGDGARHEGVERPQPRNSKSCVLNRSQVSNVRAVMIAPPTSMSFAPPSFDNAPSQPPHEYDDDDYYPSSDAEVRSTKPLPSFAPALAPDDATGEDAYARRMRLSAMAVPTPPQQARLPRSQSPADKAALRADALAKIEAIKANWASNSTLPRRLSSSLPVPSPPAAVAAPGMDTSGSSGMDVSGPPALDTSGPPAIDTSGPSPMPMPLPSAEALATISRAPVRYEVAPSTLR